MLDEWLRRYAGQSRRGDTAATWVIADDEDVVVAFATLSMTAIDLSRAPVALAKGSPDPVPALLVGRLAVDRRYSGLGLGTELVKHVLATAVELNTRAACKAIVVSAFDRDARRWWERFGFRPFHHADDAGLDLYLLVKDAETSFRDR